MTDVKPCPFCGAPAGIEKWNDRSEGQEYWAGCTNFDCPCEPATVGKTEADAIEGWNQRAEPPAVVTPAVTTEAEGTP